MNDELAQAKHRLSCRLDRKPAAFDPLIADQWVIKSLLQKSIRRGEADIAERAALTFLAQKGSDIWRRFLVIAFEEVGIASADVVAMTVAASTDKDWREASGGDSILVSHFARLLAKAPKSWSAEHLITGVRHHPSLEEERRLVGGSSIADNLAMVANTSIDLVVRAIAALAVSGIDRKREKWPGSDLPALLDAYCGLGVSEELVAATSIAAAKIRDPTTLMVPLIWLAAGNRQEPLVLEEPIPQSSILEDIPSYALDKHTRIGREAIRNFAKQNYSIRECLERYVAPAQRRDAAYMVAFYADAAPLASKLSWHGADRLEALGTEADLLKLGVPADGVEPLLEVFRANVPHLNEVRIQTVRKKGGWLPAPWSVRRARPCPS